MNAPLQFSRKCLHCCTVLFLVGFLIPGAAAIDDFERVVNREGIEVIRDESGDITYLHLKGDHQLKHLARLQSLRKLGSLYLIGVNLTADHLQVLKGLTQIHELVLMDAKFADVDLRFVGDLHRLTSLRIERCSVQGLNEDAFRKLRHLTHLKLRDCPLKDSGLLALGSLERLWYLEIRRCGIDGDQIPFEKIQGLGIADFCGTSFSDSVTSRLHKLHRLKYLSLHESSITDKSIENLASVQNLEMLDLSGTKITTTKYLSGLSKLWGLYLQNSSIVSRGLVDLDAITALQHIKLDNTRIDDEGVAAIIKHPNLLNISLNNTQITNAACEHLGGMKHLRTLWVEKTKITDEGLKYLSSCKSLRNVYCQGCPISEAGEEALEAQIPGLEVYFVPPENRIRFFARDRRGKLIELDDF
jgi:Leucine-rich repeat (LRR) protein